MPLSERARIEVYLPDLPKLAYHDLLLAFEREFCYTFGGASIARGLDGSYLSQAGPIVRDRISVVYSDIPFSMRKQRRTITRYAEALKAAAFAALEEEAILVTVLPVFHAE